MRSQLSAMQLGKQKYKCSTRKIPKNTLQTSKFSCFYCRKQKIQKATKQ